MFHQIRKQCGVSEADLLVSFRYDNLTTIKGAGKSGAFFIFTNDKRFMLKTATKEERDFLWQLLPYYLQYLRKYEHTLLPRFLGVYSMKHEGIGGVVRFVVMNNVFYSPYKPIETYDLKVHPLKIILTMDLAFTMFFILGIHCRSYCRQC